MVDRELPAGVVAGPVELRVPRAVRSVAAARRFAVDTCVSWGWGVCADKIELLVSEAVTNAVLHTGGPDVRVRVMERDSRLRLEVDDDSLRRPVERDARPGAEDGRGLALIHSLARGWGYDLRPGGKTFWFELDV